MEFPDLNKVATVDERYHLVSTKEQFEELLEELSNAEIIAVDTETEGLLYEDVVVGYCFSTKAGTGCYVPVRHEVYTGVRYDGQLDPVYVADKLRPILETVPCVGHNVKFDAKMLWKEGINCNFVDDTMIMSQLFFRHPKNGLKPLTKQYFNHDMKGLESLFVKVGNKKPIIAPGTLSPENICIYAAEDANWTLQLREIFYDMKPGIKDSQLYTIEMALLRVVSEMEATGLPVSLEFLQTNGEICAGYVERLEKETLEQIRLRLKDPEFEINLSSPKELTELLYTHLKMPVLKRSEKTGMPSTDKEVMEELAKRDPITRKIQTWRLMKKLNNTYLSGLQSTVNDDGRIRGSFNQLGTDTGRFSSSKPNLQNLPRNQSFYLWEPDEDVRDEVIEKFTEEGILKADGGSWLIWDKGKEDWVDTGILGEGPKGSYGVDHGVLSFVWSCPTRNFVQAKPGHYMLEADYSQIELRVMAGESKEPTLVNAYATGQDVHSATAAMVFGVPIERLTDNQRQAGKTINFSLLYGAGADNIAKQLGISSDEAKDLVARYFENLPSIGEWIDSTKASAVSAGFGETRLGRRRYFDKIKNPGRDWEAEKQKREAVNFMIQGAAADLMKIALVKTKRLLHEHFGQKAKILSTVHDSVLIEVHESVPKEDLLAVLVAAMEGFNTHVLTKGWPDFRIDVKMGDAWANAKEVEIDRTRPLPPKLEDPGPVIDVPAIALEREKNGGMVSTSGIMGMVTSSGEPTRWFIEFPNGLKQKEHSLLRGFRPALQNGQDSLWLRLDNDGTTQEVPIHDRVLLDESGREKITESFPKATLSEEAPDNALEVLKGLDFGL